MISLINVINSKLVIVSLVIIFNIAAQIIYKSMAITQSQNYNFNFIINMFFNWRVAAGIFLQVVSLALWFGVLKKYDLIWAGLMTSLIPIGIVMAGYFIFGETLSYKTIIGTILVVSGLFLINT